MRKHDDDKWGGIPTSVQLDVLEALDNDIISIAAIKTSKFMDNFREPTQKWEHNLTTIKTVLTNLSNAGVLDLLGALVYGKR